MAQLSDFQELLGATIMSCQTIEHDVKIMYAGMLKGNFDTNLSKIKDKPLGPILDKLHSLDISDDKPFLSEDDYDLLYEIKDIRNYWVHKGYVEFAYRHDSEWRVGLINQYNKLQSIYKRLSSLAEEIESVRLDMMKHYGRI